jgi:ribA/ribD-fused uncharacterized protein
MIKFYSSKEPYGYMNNYKKSPMFIYGRWWKNVESAYQAQKTFDPDEYHKIWMAKHPKEARDLGQLVTVRPDWDQIKVSVMYECVLNKFIQNRIFREKLFSTGEEDIAEDSPIDSFWGLGPAGNGLNHLGKILVKVRSVLRTNEYYDLFQGL